MSFVAGELREVFDPKGGAWMSGSYVPSLLAAIGNIVADHMTEIGYGDFKGAIVDQEHTGGPIEVQVHVAGANGPEAVMPPRYQCKDCGSFNIKKEGGCEVCKDCGSSKCG